MKLLRQPTCRLAKGGFSQFSDRIAYGTLALGVGLAWSTTVLSQAVPTEALPGVIDRSVPKLSDELERKPAELEKLTPKAKKVSNANEIVATFSKITFKGMSVVSNADLQVVAAKYLNKEMTRGGLARLKFEVQSLYYNRGFILVRVVSPPQDLATGTLDIVIYEAIIDDVVVANDNVLNSWIVGALTDSVKSGTVFRESNVESMVNDFNDLGNVDATLNLRKGNRQGSTSLLLTLTEVDEDEQQLAVSNHGSELTGKIVGSVNFEKSNLFRAGEKFDIDLIFSEGITHSKQFAFSIPIQFRNVAFDTRYIRSDIVVGDRLEASEITGETDIFDVALSSKLINMRSQVIKTRAGFQMRQHKSYLLGSLNTKDNVRQLFLENSYLARLPNLLLFGSLRFARGIDVLSASEQGRSQATRQEGDPEVLLVQPTFFANYRVSDKGKLQATATGQIASNTTLSSDLFILGGYGSVRGFEPAETTGDAGAQFSLEYTHEMWSGMWQGRKAVVSAGPFVDGGHVWNRVDASTQDNTLISAGLGKEIEVGLTKFGPTKLRFDAAFPIGDYNTSLH